MNCIYTLCPIIQFTNIHGWQKCVYSCFGSFRFKKSLLFPSFSNSLYKMSFLKRTSKQQKYTKTSIARKTITGDVEYDL